MLSLICAPETAAQTYVPPPASPSKPPLDRLDRRLIETVREEGAVQIWYLLNLVGDEEAPGDRAMARAVRLSLWDRLKRLLWLRLLFRDGRKAVSTSPPPPQPARLRRARSSQGNGRTGPRATARLSPGAEAVSTKPCDNSDEWKPPAGQLAFQLVGEENSDLSSRTTVARCQTATGQTEVTAAARKSALPTCSDSVKNDHSLETVEPELAADSTTNITAQQRQRPVRVEEISSAARALAKLPRRPKRRWSGWLNENWRGYKDQPVLLPTGEPAYLFGVLRRKAVITLDRGQLLGGWGDGPLRWAVLPAAEVRPLKNPHAVILGGRKLGICERPSSAKQIACRINGHQPCHPGRKRGRPRRTSI